MKAVLLGIFSAVGTTIAYLMGGWDMALQTLVIMMAIDYGTGLMLAGVFKKSPKTEGGAIDSKVGFKGLCKKSLMLVVVLLAVQLDRAVNANDIARTAVIFFFVGNEGLSIFENITLMGVPMPNFLKKMFEQLKSDNDVKEDVGNEDNKG